MVNNKTFAIAIIFLVIASIARLWHLEQNPAWYADEGTHIEIARHLMHGKTQYLGITDSYLIAARLPLFEHILALWFQCLGISMLSLRILTSLMGILSTALIYRLVISVSHDERFAIFTMGLFAIYPQATIYNRFGFSYNLLPILILTGLWCLNRYQRTIKIKYLMLTCAWFGIATLSDFIAFSFLPSLLLLILLIRPKHVSLALIALITPFAVYALLELSIHPDIFLYDLTYTLSRTGGRPLSIQFENIISNVKILLSETWWIPMGILGLLWVQPRRFRLVTLLFVFIPIIMIGRTTALYNLSAYYMIPLLPFFAVGVAAILTYLIPQIMRPLSISASTQQYIVTGIFIFLFSILSWNVSKDIQNGFNIGIEHFLIPADEAYHVQDILIDYTNSESLIIVSPTLAWMFDANITDYQLSSLSQYIDGIFFPAELYPERFAFDVDHTHAKIAIVDNLWRDWGAIHMPSVATMLTTVEGWELILQTNTIQVYHNPSN